MINDYEGAARHRTFRTSDCTMMERRPELTIIAGPIGTGKAVCVPSIVSGLLFAISVCFLRQYLTRNIFSRNFLVSR